MLTVSSAKLTAAPDDGGWVQVHDFAPEDGEKTKTRGHLFAIIATSRQEEGLDSVVAGRELLSRLHEEYFGKAGQGAFDCLKVAVTKVVGEFKKSRGEVEIAAAAVVGGVVYAAASGGARVSIFRNGILAGILASGSESYVKNEVASASGYPRKDDILILATKTFFAGFSQGVIKAAFETGDLKIVTETLAPHFFADKMRGNCGAAIIKFGDEEMADSKISPISLPSLPNVRAPELGKYARGFLSSFGQKISGLANKKLPAKNIYVNKGVEEESLPAERKTTMTIGVILLVLLIVSIGFGIKKKNDDKIRAQLVTKITVARHNLDEAKGLATLNPDRARDLFNEGENILAELEKGGAKSSEYKKLLSEFDNGREQILGEYKVAPQLFSDLTLQSSGFNGDALVSSGDQIFILDKNGKRIIAITIASKKTAVVAGPGEISNPQEIAAYEDRVFVLSAGGIDEVGEAKGRVIEKDWGGDVLIYAYAGNIYVLDKAGNTIWRYAGSGNGFSGKEKWLAAGVNLDFSKVNQIVIDGAIWCLSAPNLISRFSLGSYQPFSVSGVSPDLTGINAIYTNEELKYLYLLDKSGKRVVVVDKDGVYKAQYVSDQIGEATDLVVSEKEGKTILLAGSKLYSIELKHLD
jgi:hypothetical protein